jgi:hypothetical protein
MIARRFSAKIAAAALVSDAAFCVLCFVFCVLCFVFCVLCFVHPNAHRGWWSQAAVVEEVLGPLNRTVGGWEEYAFETAVAKPEPNYVVNTWHYHTQFEATARGFETIASNDSHFYLVYDQPASS